MLSKNYKSACAICWENIILHSHPEIEISFQFIPKILMSKECIHFFGPLCITRKRDVQTSCHNILTFAHMNSKPNITFCTHIFQQNTGEVSVGGDTDNINGFTRCTIRQLLLGVNTSRRFLENWQERTFLLQYIKRSNDLWHLKKVNAKMNTGERWCESLCTEINSLKMESRGGLTRTLFTDVS